MKKIVLITMAIALAACAGKPATKPRPQIIIKEISVPNCLASTIPASGSPCLDALRLHMGTAGCIQTETTGDHFSGPVFVRCLKGDVIAPYNLVFIMLPVTAGKIQHQSVYPWCLDTVMTIVVGDILVPAKTPKAKKKSAK